ncbi:MAG: hypothetical protein J5441_06550 [Clostridia bacterium]|nr:hypothetical protein [Clostridia bacterium]
MKKLYKRIIAVALCLALMAALVPATVFAERKFTTGEIIVILHESYYGYYQGNGDLRKVLPEIEIEDYTDVYFSLLEATQQPQEEWDPMMVAQTGKTFVVTLVDKSAEAVDAAVEALKGNWRVYLVEKNYYVEDGETENELQNGDIIPGEISIILRDQYYTIDGPYLDLLDILPEIGVESYYDAVLKNYDKILQLAEDNGRSVEEYSKMLNGYIGKEFAVKLKEKSVKASICTAALLKVAGIGASPSVYCEEGLAWWDRPENVSSDLFGVVTYLGGPRMCVHHIETWMPGEIELRLYEPYFGDLRDLFPEIDIKSYVDVRARAAEIITNPEKPIEDFGMWFEVTLTERTCEAAASAVALLERNALVEFARLEYAEIVPGEILVSFKEPYNGDVAALFPNLQIESWHEIYAGLRRVLAEQGKTLDKELNVEFMIKLAEYSVDAVIEAWNEIEKCELIDRVWPNVYGYLDDMMIVTPDTLQPGVPEDKITVADALAVLRVAAGLADVTPELIATYDKDGDNTVTVNDALIVLRIAAKLA